ncbi:MAG: hypothetical protein HFH50_10145 [Lachnospiraceae bacterium]|jgi:hypothetical protein|nr:hypothetical protein [Lachnospiraceae bacterium]
MRCHHLRFDIWLCLLFALFVSIFPAGLAERIMKEQYKNYAEEHTAAEGEIGGIAGEDIFRAQSVEDLETHEKFTVLSPGIEYRNLGAGYYKNYYLYALTLPSGERVAAAINMENVQTDGDYYTGEATLPVGQIIREDLTAEQEFISQIEYNEPLSRKDFYVDMMGNGQKASQEDYALPAIMFVRVITVLIFFPLFHALGAKFGIFPPFWVSKKKKPSEWD